MQCKRLVSRLAIKCMVQHKYYGRVGSGGRGGGGGGGGASKLMRCILAKIQVPLNFKNAHAKTSLHESEHEAADIKTRKNPSRLDSLLTPNRQAIKHLVGEKGNKVGPENGGKKRKESDNEGRCTK